ncbi:hypothetical protein ABXN37_22525 [Piscinibacter sakaiensis]|uniref:Uncharacterized protein n=1 Tax=Piscinibacter sakaiensis TaxID=1547922 RepID=A0A0K8P5L3_PISS1|nr:hypothetical protein [Piscinibacter sakaiensis]GAP37902.1 hypothetical protein ISF6_4096 [Piscinibacter sakaiensis]
MYTYYLRCRIADVPEMLALGVALGVLQQHTDDAGQVLTRAPDDGSVWDPIGPIYRETGEVDAEGMPVREPLLAPDGGEWWHANLISPVHLYQRAGQLAGEHPEIAGALQDLGRFFLLDEAGEPRKPAEPVRRLWTSSAL